MHEKDYIPRPMLVSEPDAPFRKVVRVDPNHSSFPLDALVRVTTEDEDRHILTFSQGLEGQTTRIFLESAEPPLEDQTVDHHDYWVKGDRLIEGRELQLDSVFPWLRKMGFMAMRMESNIVDLSSPSDRVDPTLPSDTYQYPPHGDSL